MLNLSTAHSKVSKKKNDSVTVLTFNGWNVSSLKIYGTNGFVLNSIKYNNEIELIAKDSNIFLNDSLLPECKISCGLYSFLILKKDSSVIRYIRGTVSISANENKMVIVAKVPLKDYLALTLASETESSDPLEYMAALSVLQKNYLLKARFNKGRHPNSELCDNTHCQRAFSVKATSKHYTAVSKGSKIELTANEPPCLYSANCGGGTLTPKEVWQYSQNDKQLSQVTDSNTTVTGRDNSEGNGEKNSESSNLTSLQAYSNVECRYCSKGKYFSWKREIQASQKVDEVIRTAPECPFIDDNFKIRFGREFGFNIILSNTVSKIERRNGKFIIYGKGFGHRIGLCQEGAIELANQGNGAAAILRFYFPNAKIISSMK